MAESNTPLTQLLLDTMDVYSHRSCLRKQDDKRFINISYRRFQTLVYRQAYFFQKQGLEAGDRVVLALENSLEWLITYVAAMLSGLVLVPLRPSLAYEMLQFVLAESEARLAILENKDSIAHLIHQRYEVEDETLSHLQSILTLTLEPDSPPQVLALTDVLNDLLPYSDSFEKTFRNEAAKRPLDTPGLICYVNSDTSRPKGALFRHEQQLISLKSMNTWFKLSEDDVALTLSSWSEVPSLMTVVHYFVSGVSNLALQDDEGSLLDKLQQSSPTLIFAPPMAFSDFYETWMAWLSQQTEAHQKVFEWALAKGKAYHRAGQQASLELRREYIRADLTFFSQIRSQVGGRVRRLYATGASLGVELTEFFDAIGMPILNVYSHSSAGGFPAVSAEDARRLGACGKIVQDFDVHIAADGEIMVRGKTLMQRFWQRPEDTKAAFDEAGWLHSGDIGYLDEDGFLFITRRKEHVLVLSNGRKIAPAPIENALLKNPFISYACVFGDGKPYLSALIVPDLETLSSHFSDLKQADFINTDEPQNDVPETKWFWPSDNHVGDVITTTAHPKIKTLIDQAIAEVNVHFDSHETIKVYSLLDQTYGQAAHEFAQALATGRDVLAKRYATEIAAMYPDLPQWGENQVTQVQVNPERLRELMEKESILDAWMTDAGIEFLFELAREKHIDIPSMVNICDAAASIAQMEREETPLSTAFIVGDLGQITRILPASQVHLLFHDHIRRMRRVLVSLTQLVDGMVMGYAVDTYGYIRGIYKLDIELDTPTSFLLGPQFRRHAAISEKCNAIVFFVPLGGRQVRVFANGQLIGRFSDGDWSPENMQQVDQAIQALVEEGYRIHILRRILQCAFTMSEENLGAIFVIGEADTILKHADIAEISAFAAISSVDMADLSNRELINFAKQDGATIIDRDGTFRGCMVLLRPHAETPAEIGPGKGARHSSAAKMSNEAQCLAITVSQDGPITLYNRGKRVLSL